MLRHKIAKKRNRAGSMAELPPALMILFALFVVPLINLLGLGLGAAAIALISFQSVSQASVQPSYATALAALSQEAVEFQTMPFMHFLNLQPAGGYQNCGIDLYVKADNFRSGANHIFGPNVPVPPPVDPTTFVYELDGHSMYRVTPWINMSGIPIVSTVPGLGKPVEMTFDVCRSVEQPNQLEGVVQNLQPNVGFSAPPQIADTVNSLVPVLGPGDWNFAK